MSVKNVCVGPTTKMLNCRVFIRIVTVLVCSSLTIGQLEGNKYIKSEVISVITHIGPTMCTNKCKSLYGCNGVNFDRQQLTCELLRIHQATDNISEKNGSLFADLPPINAAECWPNPCSQNNKCIVSRRNKPVCISTVGELLFMEIITSTNYPRNYPNYDAQNWTLAVEANSRMVLKFTVFDMETNNDFVKIYDRQNGTELYSLTGHNLPDDVWSIDSTFCITITTDHSVTYSGFSIDVYKTA